MLCRYDNPTSLPALAILIAGDTELERWQTIARLFGAALKSHLLAARHHGSLNGVHPAALLHIEPHTVLISAGVENQYGHPDPVAVKAYKRVARYVCEKAEITGVTWHTMRHTFASRLLNRGADIITVKELLGHSTVTVI
jgi:beta-lactamase superfamily II metal-dependent hydrolase